MSEVTARFPITGPDRTTITMNTKSTQPSMDLDALKAARGERQIEPFPISDKELCDRYEALFTAAVNDVLRERQLTRQTLPSTILPLRESMKVAGPAFTIKGAKSLLIKDEMKERAEMLESIPAHSVVAWDTSGDDESAQWGEVMTMAAVKRGCRGAVVDGGVRDTDRVIPQNFPVFRVFQKMNRMSTQVEHVAWQVQDPAAMAAWYGENFGFTILRKFDNPARAHFLADAAGRVVFEIYNNPKVAVPDYPSMDPLHLHIALSTDDPAGMRDRLLGAGATLVDDLVVTAAGDELAMLRDPWGFAVQLVRRKVPMLPESVL